HHPLRRRRRRTRHHQRLPSRTAPPRRDPEALQAEPPHHLRQSGALPPNIEEMADRSTAAAANRGGAPNPLQPLRRLLQQLSSAPLPEPPHPFGCLPSQAESHP